MNSTDVSRVRWSGTRALAMLVLAFEAWCVLALVALHWLRPELPPTQHRLSEYALGDFGPLMTSAFGAAALATLLLLVGLLRDGPRTWPARLAGALLKCAVVGLAASALCPMDPADAPASLLGMLHGGGLLLYVASSLLAALLLTVGFSLDSRWQPIQGRSLMLALLLGVEVVVLLRSIGLHEPWGLVNRLYALTSVTWTSTAAIRLWVVARS